MSGGNTAKNSVSKRLGLLNRYFKITRFYSFLKHTAFKGGYLIALFIAIVFLLDTFVVDINLLLSNLVDSFSPLVIFSIFLISESILGLLPPASISYLGGVISYFIGGRLFLIPAVKNYIEVKIAKHIVNLRKWGGVFVFLGAVSPLPHSMVSMACGLIKYNFKHYLLWSLFRYVRFLVYALVIFQVF
jgi:hypothetical protein